MNILLENPLPIIAIGAVLATLCGLMFLSRRNLSSLIAFAAVVVLTLLMLLTEQLVVTQREEVETALQSLLDAVEENDLPGVLAMIDPAATQVRSDAETLMPMVNVEDTGATAVEVEVDAELTPLTAISRCRGRLRGIHRKSGTPMMYFDQTEFTWVKNGQQWQLQDFTAYWKGKPLDAVNSMKGKRPTAATR